MKRMEQPSWMESPAFSWACLLFAGLDEIVWAYFMKLSNGFTDLAPTLLCIGFLAIGFFALERSFRSFGIGMAYAVFTGIGIAGTAVLGILLFGEALTFAKGLCLALILGGIVGLRIVEGSSPEEAAR